MQDRDDSFVAGARARVGRCSDSTGSPTRIRVVVFGRFSLMQISELAVIFELANDLCRGDENIPDFYELRFYSAHGGQMRSSSGVEVWTEPTCTLDKSIVRAMFVLGGQGWSAELDEESISWLDDAYRRARMVTGSVAGLSLLAQIHLRQKKGDIQEGTADLRMENDGLGILDDADAGPLSDALSIVRVDMGCDIATKIAMRMMSNANEKPIDVLLGTRVRRASKTIRSAAHHLGVNSANPLSIAEIAQTAAMSERNFLRRFKSEIGVTPTAFLLRIRLGMACRMLIETSLPADKVARRTGLGSGDRMAKLFRQHLHASPTEYRAVARSRDDASPEIPYEWYPNGTQWPARG